LLKGIVADGKVSIPIALIVIFVLLLVDFKSLWKALLAIVPLVFGVLMMIGFMEVGGMLLAMPGLWAIPMIIGIGIDDGVHLIHRYNIEGQHAHKQVFSSTGRAVLLTSLTTMLGFGSLWFASMRGLAFLGSTLFIGVGTCFIASVVVIPALAGLARKK
jgi:predicted RND superfamily exporter protein